MSDRSARQPDHERGEHHQGPIVERPFLIAGGNAAPLLEPVDAPLDDIAPPIYRGIEAEWPPWPPAAVPSLVSRVRYRIDTAFGQLVSRCDIKRVWARDLWHLSNRLLRKVLMHTVAVLLNIERGTPPLHLAQVVA